MEEVRIKDLETTELERYLKAYKLKQKEFPKDKETTYKIKAIEKALADRSLLGIETKPDKTSFFQRNILNKIKKQD